MKLLKQLYKYFTTNQRSVYDPYGPPHTRLDIKDIMVFEDYDRNRTIRRISKYSDITVSYSESRTIGRPNHYIPFMIQPHLFTNDIIEICDERQIEILEISFSDSGIASIKLRFDGCDDIPFDILEYYFRCLQSDLRRKKEWYKSRYDVNSNHIKNFYDLYKLGDFSRGYVSSTFQVRLLFDKY